MTNSVSSIAMEQMIRHRIEASIAAQQALLVEMSCCVEVAERLIEAYRGGHKAIFFGNGGSAADAQHLAAELVGKFYLDRPALPADALGVNASVLTAVGNDCAFDYVFARQVEAVGNAGDVAIGMSTSGNSRNVLEGLRAAKRRGLVTIALTGQGGGLLKPEADYCFCAPSTDTPRIQEIHMLVGHVWCELVEQALFGGPDGAR